MAEPLRPQPRRVPFLRRSTRWVRGRTPRRDRPTPRARSAATGRPMPASRHHRPRSAGPRRSRRASGTRRVDHRDPHAGQHGRRLAPPRRLVHRQAGHAITHPTPWTRCNRCDSHPDPQPHSPLPGRHRSLLARADFLRLASIFHHADTNTVSQLGVAALGLHTAQHLGVVAEDSLDPVNTSTSWRTRHALRSLYRSASEATPPTAVVRRPLLTAPPNRNLFAGVVKPNDRARERVDVELLEATEPSTGLRSPNPPCKDFSICSGGARTARSSLPENARSPTAI